MRGAARAVAAALAVASVIAVPAHPAAAHPLGNFTINLFSGLRVQPDRVMVDLVVDMAEIPTFQARRDIDTNGDGAPSAGESAAYAKRACPDAAGRITVTTGDRTVPVRSEGGDVAFPEGAAGLPTLRLTCSIVAVIGEDGGEREVVFRNRNYEDRVGWREIVAVGDGTELVATSVPATSLSKRLTDYPTDLLQSPLDQRAATVRVRPGGPSGTSASPDPGSDAVARVGPRGVDRFSQSFTRLVARQDLTLAFGLLAIVLAVVLGAVHALAPGHGKTVMAAYLVGERGSFRQAWVIGATMTATHTAGVLLLGVILSTSTTLASESLYPWLGMISGLLLAVIGASLLVRSLRSRPAPSGDQDQDHDHDHDHDQADPHVHAHARAGDHLHLRAHTHTHAGGQDEPERAAAARVAGDFAASSIGWRGLIGMGLVGGLLPSPSALVVLLGAIALGRAWFGVVLVVAYGIGMAGTLLGTGLLLVKARAGIAARLATSSPRRVTLLARVLPATTAAVVLAAGLFFAVQGATRI